MIPMGLSGSGVAAGADELAGFGQRLSGPEIRFDLKPSVTMGLERHPQLNMKQLPVS